MLRRTIGGHGKGTTLWQLCHSGSQRLRVPNSVVYFVVKYHTIVPLLSTVRTVSIKAPAGGACLLAVDVPVEQGGRLGPARGAVHLQPLSKSVELLAAFNLRATLRYRCRQCRTWQLDQSVSGRNRPPPSPAPGAGGSVADSLSEGHTSRYGRLSGSATVRHYRALHI